MSERIEGLSIGLDLDSVQVESGLKDLNKKLALVNSEMKANLSAFDKGDASLKKYQTQLDGLNKKLEIQKTKVDSARQAYEKMATAHGEGSKEAEAAATAYNKELASLNNLQRYIGSVTTEMNKSQSAFTKYGDQLTKISEKAGKLGDGLTKTVTPAVGALAAAAVLSANNMADATAKIQVNLGATAEEAEKVAGVANDVFKDGWGDSLDSVTTSLLEVKEQLADLPDDQLEAITKQAIALEQSLGMDTSETLRGVNSLMQTYGMTAQEAFDYMVTGAQNGLNKTDELGDNLAEYAPLWEQNGYSAQEMFNTLQAGLDAGAYNLDKVNDLVKEFGIRIGDGTIKTAVEEMGGSWKEIYDTWEASGESNDELFRRMAQNLASIQDPQEKAMALTEIWGSLGEDAGAKVVEALGNVTEEYENVNGAAQEVVDTLEATQSQKFQSMFRDMTDLLVPLGDILLEMGEEALPILEDAVDNLTDAWNDLSPDMQENIVQWTLMAGAAGPVIKIFGSVAGGLGAILKLIPSVTAGLGASGVAGALGGVAPAATGAGGAAALFTNPWVLGIGAVVLAAVGVGTAIYNEMHKEDKAHEEAIDATKGKYEEWYNAVIDGAKPVVESQQQIQGSVKNTGETYAEAMERIKGQNADAVTAMEDDWNGYTELIDGVNVYHEGLGESLKSLALSDDVIADIQEGYENYRLIIDNTMQEVMNTFTEGKVVSEEVAMATIAANQSVTEEVIAGFQAQKDAEQAKLDQMLETGVITKAEYDKRVMDNGMHYSMMQQITQSANDNINNIVATAARENRELTSEEVVSMIGSYATLASNSGKSLSEVAGAQDFLSANMKGMVDNVSLNALVQAGVISESAAAQVGSLGSVQEKVNALQGVIDYYNQTGIPSKSIHIDTSAALYAIADVMTRLKGIPDEQVYVNVDAGRVYTANSPTGAQGLFAGTDSHVGGPAVLGDGGRAEPFLTPSGLFGVSPATDTLYPNLPRGTKVWPSIQRFKLDIPHFATGAEGSTEAQRLIASFRNRVSEGSVTNNIGGNNITSNIDYNKLGDAVADAVISALVVADIKVEMDKRVMGRLVSELI